MQKIQSSDIIAGVTLLAGFTLIAFGYDSSIGAILIAVISAYFGKRISDNTNFKP